MKGLAVATTALAAVEARNLARMEAQPTVPAIFALDGFSPAPTTPPAPEHVAARAESSSPVLLYNTQNTCGYVSGISSAPYYCVNKGDYCALSTSANGNIGRLACCGASSCHFRTTCVNSADYMTSKACNLECRDNSYILKCIDKQYAYCNTVSFAGGAIDYACGISDISTYQFVATSYSGEVNPQTYTRYTVTGTSASGTSKSGSATGAPSPTSSRTSTTTTSSTSTPQPTSENKSSTPVGAIVGGVVGGVGALALIGIGILLFLRNKKKDNAQQSPPAPLMSQPQTGGAPPPQQQYAYPDAANAAYSTSPSATGAYYPPQQQSPQQQGSPDPRYSYQPSVSPATSYAPQPYGQPGYGQQPYQQAGSPPPMQHQYAAPPAGVAAGNVTCKDVPPGNAHEAPTANTAGHRGEMQELP
ncbi:hypothetical protein MY10362_008440 [Beauveria mimosiformis]